MMRMPIRETTELLPLAPGERMILQRALAALDPKENPGAELLLKRLEVGMIGPGELEALETLVDTALWVRSAAEKQHADAPRGPEESQTVAALEAVRAKLDHIKPSR
jgi:hypothetical protein